MPTPFEWMSTDVAEVFETMDVLLGTLGFPCSSVEPSRAPKASELFFCRRAGSDTRGVYMDEGFMVLNGSVTRHDVAASMTDIIEPKRQTPAKAETLEMTANSTANFSAPPAPQQRSSVGTARMAGSSGRTFTVARWSRTIAGPMGDPEPNPCVNQIP